MLTITLGIGNKLTQKSLFIQIIEIILRQWLVVIQFQRGELILPC
jgi:hypothetical protein